MSGMLLLSTPLLQPQWYFFRAADLSENTEFCTFKCSLCMECICQENIKLKTLIVHFISFALNRTRVQHTRELRISDTAFLLHLHADKMSGEGGSRLIVSRTCTENGQMSKGMEIALNK